MLFSTLKAFISFIQNQFKVGIKMIKIDNAFKLGSIHESIYVFKEKGIIHQKSNPYSPQHNVIVEKKHKHILETV